MILTSQLLKTIDAKELLYTAKSLVYKVDLRFSYQFDEDRFIAASQLEVKSFGKILFEESRSSRYFIRPDVIWSDFSVNGKILRPPANAFDLCLLPLAFQLQPKEEVIAYSNDWKLWIVDKSVDEIQVKIEKNNLLLTADDEKIVKQIIISSKVLKSVKLERV